MYKRNHQRFPVARRSRSQPEHMQMLKLNVVNVFNNHFIPTEKCYVQFRPRQHAESFKDIINQSRRRSLYEIYKQEKRKAIEQSISRKIKSHQSSLDCIELKKASNLEPLHRHKQIHDKRIEMEIQRLIVETAIPLELVSQKVKLVQIRASGQSKKKRQELIMQRKFPNEFMSQINKKWRAQHKKISRTLQISKKFNPSGSPWKTANHADDSPIKLS